MPSALDRGIKKPKKLTISEYIDRKQAIDNTTFIIKAGTGIGVYLVDGKEISMKEFKETHEMFVMNFNAYNSKGPNIDTRRDWLMSD